MIRKQPILTTRDMTSEITQAKVIYLTQDMGQAVSTLVNCPVFLNLSLCARIGPRWAFWCKHCAGKPFVLNTQLTEKDGEFLRLLSSESLDAECQARDMSRAELFSEETGRWQREEGRVYKEMDRKLEDERRRRRSAKDDLMEDASSVM